MDRSPPTEALGFADATRGALARLGGVDLARRAEADPSVRRTEVEPVLRQLGLLDLAPLEGATEMIAAALAVREAGAVVSPWPLAQALAVTRDVADEADGVYAVGQRPHRLDHLDLFDAPLAVDLRGEASWWPQAGASGVASMPLDPFGVRCSWKEASLAPPTGALALSQTLSAFWVLGALRTVVNLAAQYAGDRQQFGRPIGRFGAMRWRLADMVVATTGLEELASYTLWRIIAQQVTSADVLALRLIALESAQLVLDHGHQVFAAIGLCDEHDLSIIDRHLQPVLRRPAGRHETNELLADSAERDGFDGLFPIAGRQASDGASATADPKLDVTVGENP